MRYQMLQRYVTPFTCHDFDFAERQSIAMLTSIDMAVLYRRSNQHRKLLFDQHSGSVREQ